MRRWVIGLAWALCGCGDGHDEDDLEGGADSDRPSAYTSDTADGGDEVPAMGPEDAASSAFAGLNALVSSRPSTIVEAFESLAVFEEGCPEQLVDIDEGETRALQWYTPGCTTSAGLHVRGGGRLERYAGMVAGERVSSGVTLSAEGGTFRLETSDGRFLQLSGYLVVDTGTYAEGRDGFFGFVGDVSADPQTASGSALLDGSIRAQAEMYAADFPEYRALTGRGAVSGAALGAARAMSFDDIVLVAEVCAREPAGSVAVRDELGFWHDIVFDAATWTSDGDYQWHPELCDGCGAYIAGGVESGEACVAAEPLAALLAWEEIPW